MVLLATERRDSRRGQGKSGYISARQRQLKICTEELYPATEPRERGGAGICRISTSGSKRYVILFSLSPTGNACCAIEFKFGKSLQ